MEIFPYNLGDPRKIMTQCIRKVAAESLQRHSEAIVKYNIGFKLSYSRAYQNLYFMVI